MKRACAWDVCEEFLTICFACSIQDNPKMDGYQRKKCVAKILYMYVLGYEPDFGYAEALRLLSSRKFSEKQMVRDINLVSLENVVASQAERIG